MEVSWLLRLAQIRLRQLRRLGPKSSGYAAPQKSIRKTAVPRSVVGFVLGILITVLIGVFFAWKASSAKEKKEYELSHPKPYSSQNGWQIYRAADLARLSQQVEGRINRVIYVEGNVRVVGSLENARIWATEANLIIAGDVQASEIKVGDGKVTAGSVTEGSGIIIKREGTVTVRDVSHSTIEAKHIVVHSAVLSDLLCQTAQVTGTVARDELSRHPWRDIP